VFFGKINLKYFCGSPKWHKRVALPPWLSPVERLAVNQSVKGPNPFGGAKLLLCRWVSCALGFSRISPISSLC
jgi:hypothetical protein